MIRDTMMMKNKKIFSALLLALFSSMANSAPLYCEGKVARILTYSSGEVMILSYWRGDWTTICSLEAPRGGVPVGVCKNWFSQLSAAVIADKGVIIYYPDSGNTASCSALPLYGAGLVPGYVSLKE